MSAPPPEPNASSSSPTAWESDADVLMGNGITDLLEGVTRKSGWGGPKHAWEPPDKEELKRLFPAYEIQSLLGRGGMGVVYKAYDLVLRKTVAIKLLPPALAEDAQLIGRFKREAHVMNSLDHPGIVKVHTFVQTPDGHAYFVMDYVEGKTVHELVQAKQISVRKALRLVVQICRALQYLHDKKIIHRDIKPSNIIVDTNGNARLLDFGIAGQLAQGTENLTLTGQNPGTPFYIAPELYRGNPPTPSSDIYSLGVTLYEMLTGECPRIQAPLPSKRSTADRNVDKVVIRALAEQPNARYQNADEMRKDIQRCSRASKEFRQAILIGISLIVIAAAMMTWLLRPSNAGRLAGTPVAATPSPTPLPAPPQDAPLPEVPVAEPIRENAVPEPTFVNSLGMKFVPVPGTHVLFSIWETRVRDFKGYAEVLKYGDKWKNQMEHDLPVSRGDDDPMMYVSWLRANTYCDWLTETEIASGILPKGARYRLPTDLEWSAAAGLTNEQGTSPQDRSEKNTTHYPWGNSFPPPDRSGNYRDATFQRLVPKEPGTPIPGYDDGHAVTSPVGSYPPNDLGIYDLGGNVSEWCADRYAPGDKRLILRGGNYMSSDPQKILTSSREPFVGDDRYWRWFGFRCVLDLSNVLNLPAKVLNTASPQLASLQSASNPGIEEFKTILHGHGWSYEDSLYPGSNEQPPTPMYFYPNGKFHDKWKWNYWIVAPGIIHVQFWDAVYKPETAVVLKFNDSRTEYSGEFKDKKGKLHKITGTRLAAIK